MITGYTFALLIVMNEMLLLRSQKNIYGLLGADKGYLRPELTRHLESQGIDLQTPFRKNMKDSRPKDAMRTLMKARRKIETVIGQLTDRFHIQKVRAKLMAFNAPYNA